MIHANALMAEGTLLMQCVAIDAREERIAAGDISGRIHMWNAFGPAVAAAAGEARFKTCTWLAKGKDECVPCSRSP